MSLEIAGACRPRILAAIHRHQQRLGGGEIALRVEGAEREPAGIHVAQTVHGKEQIGAYGFGRLRGGGFKPRDGGVESAAHHNGERRGAKCARAVEQFHGNHVRAVGHPTQIGIYDKGCVAQITRHAVEGAEFPDDRERRIGGRARRAAAKLCARIERAREFKGWREPLFDAHGPAARRIHHLTFGAEQERARELCFRSPRPTIQQREPLGVEPPLFGTSAQLVGGGELHIVGIDLRLEFAVRVNRILERRIGDAQRQGAGQGLGAEDRRNRDREERGGGEGAAGANVHPSCPTRRGGPTTSRESIAV